ncbi:protein RRP5 homolog [Stigmatopora nigra]
MDFVEKDFPRGGADKKTSESKIRTPIGVDNLFQSNDVEAPKKRKFFPKDDRKEAKKQKTIEKSEDVCIFNAPPEHVQILHLKELKEGMLLLGCVKEVSNFDVRVGLPGGLQGFLSIRDICDSYTKMLTEHLDSSHSEDISTLPQLFNCGMILRCIITKLDTSKKAAVNIQVSINPKLVNKALKINALKVGMVLSGCVESLQEHGCLVDIGIEGTKAFLLQTTGKRNPNSINVLKVGEYVTCQIKEVKNDGHLLRLDMNPLVIGKARAESQQGWNLTNLLPGLLVEATIKQVTKHGLLVSFLSSFNGQVDFLHMEREMTYNVGKKVLARVLYMEPSTGLVGLSLRGYLVQSGTRINTLPASGNINRKVVEKCQITTLHPKSGAMLKMPDKTLAFVNNKYMQQFYDIQLRAIPETSCRIIVFSTMDQIHFATLHRDIIMKPCLGNSDLRVGQIVQGTVSVLLNHGMMVNLPKQIQGMVPFTHLSDIVLENPEEKYSEGMKVECRVLSINGDTQRVALTLKKTLIKSTLPLFRSYDDACVGMVSHGYIVSIISSGCLVRFYNDVRGLVPIGELGSEDVLNPTGLFSIGQVVKARVLDCDPVKQTMLLSFKADPAELIEETKVQFKLGKKLDAVIIAKSTMYLEVVILPKEVHAILPIEHLSDLMSHCRMLSEALQEGDTISNLVCVFQDKKRLTLTKKPAVIWSLEEGLAAKDISEIVVGMQMIGWVKKIISTGIFVDFPYGIVGFASISAISDGFIPKGSEPFKIGQTVIAKVTNLNEDKNHILVTLKISEVTMPEGAVHNGLKHAVQERRALSEMTALRDTGHIYKQLAALTVGQRLELLVGRKKCGDAYFESDELVGATIRAAKDHVMGIELTPGQKVDAVVLYADIFSSTVHVSLLPKLVGKTIELTKKSHHFGILEHYIDDLAIISVGNCANLTFIQTKKHLNEIPRFESKLLSTGIHLSVEVVEPNCEQLQGFPLVSWQHIQPKWRSKVAQDKTHMDPGCQFGEIVEGKVCSVKPTSIQVTLKDGMSGFIHVSEVMKSEEVAEGSFPTASVEVGSMVTCRVIGGKQTTSYKVLPISNPRWRCTLPELTIIPSKLDDKIKLPLVTAQEKLRSYKAGNEITCFVSKFNAEMECLEVTCDNSVFGTVELLTLISHPEDYSHLEKLYKIGQAVKAKVVKVSLQRLILSLSGIHELEAGKIVLGRVTSFLPQLGVRVKLPFGEIGNVAVTDIADEYKPNPLAGFQKDQLLRVYLLGSKDGKWQLSLRASRVSPQDAKPAKDVEVLSLDDMQDGQLIRGYVKFISGHGVFIRLSNNIIGRATPEQSTKYIVHSHNHLSNLLPADTLVMAKIIRIDRENNWISLSLLAKDTGNPDVLPESLGLPLRHMGNEKKKHELKNKSKRSISESEETINIGKKKEKTSLEDSDSGVEVYFREEEDQEDKSAKAKAGNQVSSSSDPSRLRVETGFSWELGLSSLKPATANNSTDWSDVEEQEESKPQKKSRQELEREKKVSEKALAQRELDLMDPKLRPQDAAEFERLLLASPNSSLLWLQFMAQHLQAAQIEQARAVAERALKTISFREEQEKLNVWVALLNLENMYGTQESLKKVFERALQFCEPVAVYQQLADIYATSDKIKEADNLYKSMVKRFRQNNAVWLSYGTFLIKRGQSDEATALLQRALSSLPPKESVDIITKFAKLEFRFGNTEKGRTMFDKVLTSYPKRTDLWSVFIDLMVKHGSQKDVRAIFDRVIHLSVAIKKIKFFFKRYLEYEKKHGTPQTIQAVKDKAMEFVEGKANEVAS